MTKSSAPVVSLKALSEYAAVEAGTTKKFGHDFAKAISFAIAAALSDGSVVSIPGVGRIRSVQRGARTWHNPRTGDTVKLPERRAVKFTASKPLLDMLNGHEPAKSAD